MLGFFQYTIAITVELLVVLYLTSQTVLTDVIMKFVALAAIARFDDMYAGALYEEKMLKVVGKKLPTEYRRCMAFRNTQEQRDECNAKLKEKLEKDDGALSQLKKAHAEKNPDIPFTMDNLRGNKAELLRQGFMFNNPREGYFSLKFLRWIFKFLRMYYVTINYYFLPIITLLY